VLHDWFDNSFKSTSINLDETFIFNLPPKFRVSHLINLQSLPFQNIGADWFNVVVMRKLNKVDKKETMRLKSQLL